MICEYSRLDLNVIIHDFGVLSFTSFSTFRDALYYKFLISLLKSQYTQKLHQFVKSIRNLNRMGINLHNQDFTVPTIVTEKIEDKIKEKKSKNRINFDKHR
jgi:hypothetical protein